MIYSLLYGLLLWVLLATTPFAFIPLRIMKLFGKKDAAWEYLNRLARIYTRFLLKMAGARFIIHGFENIPKERNICIVANHQSYADIVTFFSILPFMTGFIAKKELGQIPLLRTWMIESGCYFLKRDSLKDGLIAILHGVDRVKRNLPMTIFPEGRRSMGKRVLPFHKGSLKLATKAKAILLPVSIQGTFRLLEATGRVTPSTIGIKFHEPINTAILTPSESDELAEKVQTLIENGIEELKLAESQELPVRLPVFSTKVNTKKG